MMLSKSDTEIIRERLQNWGRWAADRNRRECNIIYRMMRLYGEIPPRCLESEYFPPIDVLDALRVEQAWRELPNSPVKYRKVKRVLAVEYTIPQSIPLNPICKLIRIPKNEYKELLKIGHYMMFFRLVSHACKKIQVV